MNFHISMLHLYLSQITKTPSFDLLAFILQLTKIGH
jgi:hypothetical protein